MESAVRYKSSCRVCGAWTVQNKHWMPKLMKKDYSNAELLNDVEWRDGSWQECIPSNNLEYLEYEAARKGL